VFSVIVILFVVRKTWDPVERGFFCDDTSIRYPYDPHEKISDKAFLLGCVSLPMGVVSHRIPLINANKCFHLCL